MAKFKGQNIIFGDLDGINFDTVELYAENNTLKLKDQNITDDKSLVDKEYVDNAISGQALKLQVGEPYPLEDGHIWLT